ncbi:carbohydrate ABC transporter permease [Crystallibacter degradans]|uniref:carbohydrate ABC transporter permease n=1 Tax=Crystallibacter degradans TaxID=2726743 RepID=UPI001473DB9A|nr:sugar ABC transporter permease [Arthrobacter sp. SF27]NMR32045.1 sugar ABC transporter permease [Arthrobacter sp. SF27]
MTAGTSTRPALRPGAGPGHGNSGRTGALWLKLLPLAPAIALLGIFLAGPIIFSIYGSFTNAALTGKNAKDPQFIGFENYADLFRDPNFPQSLWLTVLFVFASAIVGQNLLGLGTALLMNKATKAIAAVVGVCVVAAWVLPEIVAAFVAYAFFFREGTLNQLTATVGIAPVDWLFEHPMLAIILANIWRGTAFSMMVYQAALNDVPQEISESAMIDGAGGALRLWYITLPMIRRSIATNLMLITLQTLAVFTLIYVMTAGGPSRRSATLPVMAYEEAFRYSNIGYGTAIAVVMILIGAVFSVVYIRLLKEK